MKNTWYTRGKQKLFSRAQRIRYFMSAVFRKDITIASIATPLTPGAPVSSMALDVVDYWCHGG